MAVSHLTVLFSVSLGSFDLVCTECFQVLDAEDGNINEMPKQCWLAGLCEQKKGKKKKNVSLAEFMPRDKTTGI